MGALPSPVLLTGASGFIGRRLHVQLLNCGVAVRALVRPASVARGGLDPRCEIVSGELDDGAAWRRALTGVAAVVYGAGTVRGRVAADFEPANVTGVIAMVDALGVETPPPPVLLISSLAASRPELSWYAGSKRSGERVLQAAALPWCVLRPPAVYGPGDQELRPLLALVRRGLALRPGPPEQRLSLLHVEDLARAVVAWLGAEAVCQQQTFAIDDGRADGYSWDDIGLAVAGHKVRQVGVPGALLRAIGAANRNCARWLGYQPMLTPGKARELQQARWLCDNRAFTNATGWLPEIDLERGAAALFQ